MANNTYEEVLRFLIEAKGDEDVARLARQIIELGDAGEEAEAKTAALLDEFGKARGLNKTATEFRDLGGEVVELGQKYQATRAKIEALAKDMAAVEEPTTRQVRDFERLSGQLDRTGQQLGRSREQWRSLRTVLEENGVATKRYSDLQDQIVSKQRQSTDAIRAFAAEQLKVRDAANQTAQRLADQDEAFRRQARSSKMSADALRDYRARAEAAKQQTEGLAQATDTSTRLFDRMRGVAAGVLGFLSFSTVISGIKAIVTEGSNAEQELGQLEAVLASTGRQAEFTSEQLLKMAETSAKSSKFSAGEIVNLQARLLSYTNIVGSTFPAATQAAIDQAARLGIGLEQSAEIIGRSLQEPEKAMQALGRQGFYLEDSQKALITQLVATGRTAEAQAEILDLLTESYGGAAAAGKVGTIAGLWKAAASAFNDWQQQISNRGVLEYFKQQLRDTLATAERLGRDGTLGRWAQQTADAIVGVARVVQGTTRFLVDHAGALAVVGRAYAALKIAQAIVAMNAWRVQVVAATTAALANAGALNTATGAATRFGRALRAIPGSIQIAVGLVGLDLAIKGARSLGEVLGRNSEAALNAGKVSERVRAQLRLEAQQRAEMMAVLARYRDITVMTAGQVAQLGDVEREAYQKRLAGLQQYLSAQLGYLLRQKEMGLATADQLAQLAELPGRLAAVRGGYAAIAEGVRLAASAMQNTLTPAAQKILEQLKGIERDGKLAASSVKSLFDGLNFVEGNTLGDVALALAHVAEQSAGADRNIREGLQASLRQLSGEDLLRFQSAAVAAFDALKRGPAETAAVLDSTLLVAMERLGVSAEQMGIKFTDAGRDATAAFSAIVENANATGSQIETAFAAALSRVATLDEARALGSVLEQAGLQGKVGFDAAERSAAALRNRLGEIQTALDPLTRQFELLGIKSKAELDRARDAAKGAFDAIRDGAARGEASIDDVRAAFQKYSEAARAAATNSNDVTRSRVENELEVLDAIYSVNTGLDEMAERGTRAGRGISHGAREAVGALDTVAASASKAAQKTDESAAASSRAGAAATMVGDSANNASIGLGQMNDALTRAYMATNRYVNTVDTGIWSQAVSRVTQAVREQAQALQQLNDNYDEQLSKLDPITEKMEKLRGEYTFLDDSRLRATAEKQQRLEDEARRHRDEARAIRDEAVREREQATSGSRAPGSNGPLAGADAVRATPLRDLGSISITLPDGTSGQMVTDQEGADLMDRMLDQLARSRAMTTRKRR